MSWTCEASKGVEYPGISSKVIMCRAQPARMYSVIGSYCDVALCDECYPKFNVREKIKKGRKR